MTSDVYTGFVYHVSLICFFFNLYAIAQMLELIEYHVLILACRVREQ